MTAVALRSGGAGYVMEQYGHKMIRDEAQG